MAIHTILPPVLTDVVEGDWAPDGVNVAVTHVVQGRYQLEYPAGKVIHTAASGYLSDPHVSPDGTHVAFFEHPIPLDNRGLVRVAGPDGVRTLAGEYWGLEGLAWADEGRSVMFSASSQGNDGLYPMKVNITGEPHPRQALTGATVAALTIYDMCKSISHGMVITEVRLLAKSGGKSDVAAGGDAPGRRG